VSPLVVGLILVAAVLHLAWNVLLKTAGDPLRAAWIGMTAGATVMVPAGIAGWLLIGRPSLPAEAFGLAAVSGAIEAVYFVLLSAAYRRGDLSVVYPIARGTAPLLAVAVGVFVLGETLGPAGALGVAAVLAGLLVLQRPWVALRRLRASATSGGGDGTGFALGAGITIALYSAVDRVGVRLVAPWLYAAMLWLFMAISVSAFVLAMDRFAPVTLAGTPASGDGLNAGRRLIDGVDIPRAAVGGVLTLAAYLLILVALSVAPLAIVAPLRESAIVLASGWGVLRLGEAAGWRAATERIGAAAVVLVGAILLALDR
jgi:drug/metabolite transporter (DMT)-like permease